MDLTIKLKPGKANSNADALSRNISTVNAVSSEEVVPSAPDLDTLGPLQWADLSLIQMLQYLTDGLLPAFLFPGPPRFSLCGLWVFSLWAFLFPGPPSLALRRRFFRGCVFFWPPSLVSSVNSLWFRGPPTLFFWRRFFCGSGSGFFRPPSLPRCRLGESTQLTQKTRSNTNVAVLD